MPCLVLALLLLRRVSELPTRSFLSMAIAASMLVWPPTVETYRISSNPARLGMNIFCMYRRSALLPRAYMFSNPSIPPNHIARPSRRQPLPCSPSRRPHRQTRRNRRQLPPSVPTHNSAFPALSLIREIIPFQIAIPARQNNLHLHTLGT